MKLYRFADQAIVSVMASDRRRAPRGSARPKHRRRATATSAHHAAAQRCTARRTGARTSRTSSATDTASTATNAGSQPMSPPPGNAGGSQSATGRKPAQMAQPPARGIAPACSERPFGVACGSRGAKRASAATRRRCRAPARRLPRQGHDRHCDARQATGPRLGAGKRRCRTVKGVLHRPRRGSKQNETGILGRLLQQRPQTTSIIS